MARGKPWGFALPPARRAGGRVSGFQRGREALLTRPVGQSPSVPPPWSPPLPRSPPPVVAVLKEAVSVRSEVSFTVRGFCVLPSLHLSKAKPVCGVAWTVCVLPSSKVPPPETLPLALVGRAGPSACASSASWCRRVGGASRAGGVSIGFDGRGDIHVGLALLDGLEDGRLGRTRGHEIELGVGEEVAELAARLPADRDALDVLRAELLCRLRALAAEREGEVAELAEADLLALQQLLAHAVDCHVEDRHDVGAGVGRAVVGDVAGKLLDSHHLGVLCRGEVVGDDGPDECLVLGVGLLALGLGLG